MQNLKNFSREKNLTALRTLEQGCDSKVVFSKILQESFFINEHRIISLDPESDHYKLAYVYWERIIQKKLLKWGGESVFRTYKQRQNRFLHKLINLRNKTLIQRPRSLPLKIVESF